MSRVLGIDYGQRRIGVAISDPTRTIAQPLPTLQRRRGRRPPYARLLEIIAEWEITCIVVGLPIETSGAEGHQAREVRAFGDALGARAGIPIEYWDERLSSVRAQRELALLDLPAKARRQKERVDAMAATLILQEYLDAHGKS